MIENNIIYNFEDFRTLITSKAKEGAYYLLYDDIYFEKIERNTMITREVYSVANRYTKSFNIIKYMNFKIKNDYKFKELAAFFELLRQYNKILVIIYNPKNKECFILFISNKDDSKIIEEIERFLEIDKNNN